MEELASEHINKMEQFLFDWSKKTKEGVFNK